MQPVGVGLVGAGAFGQFCLDAFAAMPEVKIVGISDINVERAHALAERYRTQAFISLESVLENPALHVIAINTPPYLHAEQGLAVLRAGKHLFCEKPLALTYQDGQQLVEAAAENHVLLTVDYVMRHNPFWAIAMALTRHGVFGTLRHMDLANHAAGLELPRQHWFWDMAKSGGIWVEHGVHFFDAFAWVSGQRGEITAAQAFRRADGSVDQVEALARYGKCAAHFYHAFDQSAKTEQTTVKLTYERAYITLREWIPTSMEVLTTEALDHFHAYLPDTLTIHVEQVGEQIDVKTYAPEGKSSLYRECIQSGMRNLINVVHNPHVQLTVTGADGLESLRLALECNSAQEVHDKRILL